MEEMGSQTSPVSAGSHKALNIIVGLVILVVLLFLGLWLKDLEDARGVTEEIKPGQEITRVEQGRVVKNFPNEFLPKAGTVIQESYSISYTDKGVEQPVIRYISTESLADNVSAFATLLDEGGWDVVHEADADAEDVTFFYATSGLEEVNITLVAEDEGTMVNIAYVIKEESLTDQDDSTDSTGVDASDEGTGEENTTNEAGENEESTQ